MKISEIIEELQWQLEELGDIDVEVNYINEFYRPKGHKNCAGMECYDPIKCVQQFIDKDGSTGLAIVCNHTYGYIEGELCDTPPRKK